MKTLPSLLLFFFTLCGVASAQWQNTTYNLKGGWNSIYLHGDASHDTPDGLFASGDAANIEEVWRWNPNPTQVQFTTDPLIPTPGTPEWSVWYRGNPGASTLDELSGQTAYLIKCAGAASAAYAVQIKHRPKPPAATWVRHGANLLGFPSFKNGANYPTLSSYFATFPAAIAANTKVFKYVGGDLGPGNPLQVFSPTFERLDRNQAYWFEAEVVGNFYAPVEVTAVLPEGLAFGRSRSSLTVRLRNRTNAVVTVTITPQDSDAAPNGYVPGVSGAVPLTKKPAESTTDPWPAINGSFQQQVGPQSSVEIVVGVNRGLMSQDPADFYASFLKFTDSSNLMEVFMPVSAQPGSLTGLWVGDVQVSSVSSRAARRALATATLTEAGAVEAITVDFSGRGYTTAPTVTLADPISGSTATAVAQISNGEVSQITVSSGGSGYLTTPTVTLSEPDPLPGTGVVRAFPLRFIIHVDNNGVARLLSQAFTGVLDATDNPGVTTLEAALRQDKKRSASRISVVHLPLDLNLAATSGTFVKGGTLGWEVVLPFDDKVNPFVHQYHPDHNNLDFDSNTPLADKKESYTVTRALTFELDATEPAGIPEGWGTVVMTGNYTEAIQGLYGKPATGGGSAAIQTGGTFLLRRVTDDGVLVTTAP